MKTGLVTSKLTLTGYIVPDYAVTVYTIFTSYRRDNMKTISATQRLAAVALAISVTLSLVWGMASLGYPASASAAQAAAARVVACDGGR